MWSENNNDILAHFIRARGITDEKARSVLGVALLAQRDDERLYGPIDLLGTKGVTLDTPLLLEILETASAPQIASVLWSPIGRHFSAAQFEKLYRTVLDTSPIDFTLYELVGAAVDFLRLHPGEFSISSEIVSRLLESPHIDSRIVAMKALSHSQVSLGYCADCILRCLQSSDNSEKDIGLYQLGELIDREGNRLSELLDTDRIRELHRVLDGLAGDDDEARRISAAVRRDALSAKPLARDQCPGPASLDNRTSGEENNTNNKSPEPPSNAGPRN